MGKKKGKHSEPGAAGNSQQQQQQQRDQPGRGPQQQQQQRDQPGRGSQQQQQQRQRDQSRDTQQQQRQRDYPREAQQQQQQRQRDQPQETPRQEQEWPGKGKRSAKGKEKEQQQHPQQQQQQQQQKVKEPEQAMGKGDQQLRAQTSPAKATQQAQPPRQTVSTESVTKQMAELSTCLIPKRITPNRPKKENRGRPFQVDTNHLALSIKDNRAIVYHYDVVVTPERPFKFYWPALNAMQKKYYPNQYPAFDGKKNIYSYKKLPTDKEGLKGTVQVWDEERMTNRDMTVEIKFANTVNIGTIGEYLNYGNSFNSPQEAIQALDIVLRSPGSNRFVKVGRSFFSPPPGKIIDLGGGLDLWYGFYQSAIIGWRPFLNIDVAHKGFPQARKCIEILCDFLRTSPNQLSPTMEPDRRSVDDFKSFIKNLRIVYELPRGGQLQKRTYRVSDLTTCPRNNFFQMDNKRISVEQYFRDQYNFHLRFPLIPCLEVGTKPKSIAIPLELCTVLDRQVSNKKLNELQTRNMVRAAAVSTDMRRQKIENSIKNCHFNDDPVIKEFGISVATDFTKVDARVLDPPQLLYNKSVQKVFKGTWKMDRFIKTMPLTRWGILNAENRGVNARNLTDLASSLIRNGSQLGMDICDPSIENKSHPRDIERTLNDWKRANYELAVVILPDRGVSYGKIKQMAEQKIGILTQCLRARTLQKLSPSTVMNILLKINSKHNGINHNITCSIWEKHFSRPIIVFGADVTHPSPGQENVGIPSVAAVAASYEPKAFCYNFEWRFQQPREEMIEDLENIVKKQLLAFYNHNRGLKPERILFYRDGVSEGQFKKVMDIELQAVRRACRGMGPDYQPPITFLVVQKRHHTRFFPQNPRDGDGSRNNNVPAGTVVDTKITHVNEIDFYLVSHASIQGTARPTKYHVLWDDSNMSEDDIEEITYYLCHLFSRCTRAVSYPAPTYYAHLAAFRAKSYSDDQTVNLQKLDREYTMKKALDDFVKKSPMFFV